MIIMRPRAADYIAPPGFCPLHDTFHNEPPKMSEPVLYLLSGCNIGRTYTCLLDYQCERSPAIQPTRYEHYIVVELSLKNIYSSLIHKRWKGNACIYSKIGIDRQNFTNCFISYIFIIYCTSYTISK